MADLEQVEAVIRQPYINIQNLPLMPFKSLMVECKQAENAFMIDTQSDLLNNLKQPMSVT